MINVNLRKLPDDRGSAMPAQDEGQGGLIASGYPGVPKSRACPYEAVDSPKSDAIAGGNVGERNRISEIKE